MCPDQNRTRNARSTTTDSRIYRRFRNLGWLIHLHEKWLSLRYSLWFVPTVIVLAAIVLAILLVRIDEDLQSGLTARFPRLLRTSVEGARVMLSAIASSMITVAGVIFSITVVALTLASDQFSPRILRNFMSSRETKTVLGIFVGVYAYCLIVLRSIRGSQEESYVPSLAVFTAVILAIVGVYFLIFFIHHIAKSIQITQVLGEVSLETKQAIDELFPSRIGEAVKQPENDSFEIPSDGWDWVLSTTEGYIQTLDSQGLLDFAAERNGIIRMERAIGEYVIPNTPIASFWCESQTEKECESRCAKGADALQRGQMTDEVDLPPKGQTSFCVGTESKVHDEDHEAINSLFVCGRNRTVRQDAAFGIQLIVDIALKALSPGINDTATALHCIDTLSGILADAASREDESLLRFKEGRLRVIAKGPDFASLLRDAFVPIRRSSNVAVLLQLLKAIEKIGFLANTASRRQELLRHVDTIVDHAQKFITAEWDCAEVTTLAESLRNSLARSTGPPIADAVTREKP